MRFAAIFLLTFPLASLASCPWKETKDLLRLDSFLSVAERVLTVEQVREDLDCYRFIASQYVFDYPRRPEQLMERLASLRTTAESSTALELARSLWKLHEGMRDMHFGYEIGDESFADLPVGKKNVRLIQKLPEDMTYFSPGDLAGQLTEAQLFFIENLSSANGKFVIDLRGNGGGEDLFAFGLARALFTAEEHVPQTRRLQMSTAFTYAGLLNLVRLLDYRGKEEFEADVLPILSQYPLIENSFEGGTDDESELLKGERATPFTGKIILLVDGGCASSCETVIEKLSVHPAVTVRGQPTYGALHFSNAAVYQLPHSGILVRLPTLRQFYENDAPEGVGYTPDVIAEEIDLSKL